MTALNRSRGSPLSATLARGESGTLLMVGPMEETAKRIESHLRNSGHPLRCAWTNELAELEDILDRSPPDLVFCDIHSPTTPAAQVIHMVGEQAPDLPVLVVGHTVSPQETAAALSLGAKDLVCADDVRHLRHLEMVVIREFLNHRGLATLRMTRERLEEFEARHRQLIKGTADAIAQVHEGIISQANSAFVALMGREHSADLVGVPLADLVAAEQRSRVKERLRHVLKGKHSGEPLEFSLCTRDFDLPVTAQLILTHDDGERAIEMLIRSEKVMPPGGLDTATDNFESTLVTTKIASSTASATAQGRSDFLISLNQLAPRGNCRAALFLVIDGFTGLEDRVTLVGAEELSQSVRNSLLQHLQTADELFQFSMHEFAFTVNRPQLGDIEALGALVREHLTAKIFITEQHEAHLTFTLCIYPLAATDQAHSVLHELASEARKLSVRGGNTCTLLGAAAKTGKSDQADAHKAALLKKQLEENRLKLAYQMIASLEGDARQHYDVLLRMVDEHENELHAAEFLPAAARFGMMRAVDRWVVARAMSVVVKRGEGADAPSLFIKVSEDSIKDADNFVKWLTELLTAHPLKYQELVFEISEPILQNHVRKAVQLSESLRKLGAGIAICHFGLTSASAQLLENLGQVDFLKFHSSFTERFNDKDLQRKMTTLMEVAKTQKIKTIVSHVEDANVMARLWQMGVNYILGYHVQEPEVVMMGSDLG